jgi:hypothetical protein
MQKTECNYILQMSFVKYAKRQWRKKAGWAFHPANITTVRHEG